MAYEENNKKEKEVNISTELSERGFNMFMGDVTQETMKPLIEWIIAENFNQE